MTIEKILTELTAAVEALTAAMSTGKPAKAAAPAKDEAEEKPKATSKANGKAKPEEADESDTPTHDEVVAAADAMAEAEGNADGVKALLKKFDAAKLPNIEPDERAAFIKAAKKATRIAEAARD